MQYNMIKPISFKRNNIIRGLSLVAIACLLCTGPVLADPDGSGDGGCLDCDTAVPFDGGVSLLVAAGIGYGAKKAHEARKKNAGNTNKIG